MLPTFTPDDSCEEGHFNKVVTFFELNLSDNSVTAELEDPDLFDKVGASVDTSLLTHNVQTLSNFYVDVSGYDTAPMN